MLESYRQQLEDIELHQSTISQSFAKVMAPSIIFAIAAIIVAAQMLELSLKETAIIVGIVIASNLIALTQTRRYLYTGFTQLLKYAKAAKDEEQINYKFRFDAEKAGFFKTPFQIFNLQRQLVDDILTQLYASVARLEPMSNELTNIYAMMMQKASMQDQLGKNLAGVLADVNAQSQALKQDIDNIFSAVEQVNKASADINQSANQNLTEVQHLGSEMTSAQQQIQQLDRDSEQISSVINVISSIAEQTNLLALNAAIEAARAGEAGRGFAVVADEVRSLAEKTATSTVEVTDMLQKIQHGTRELNQIIEQGVSASEQTISSSARISEQFSDVQNSMAQIHDLSEKIARDALDQEDASKNAQSETSAMVELNHEVLSSTQQQELTSADLIKLANRIRSFLDHFSFNDAIWDNGNRIKKAAPAPQAVTSAAAADEDDDNIELF